MVLTNKCICDTIKNTLIKRIACTGEATSEGHWKFHSVEIWVKEAVKTADSKRDYTQPEKEE